MPRPLRYVQPGGGLFEVVSRCFQGRALLRPSKTINHRIVGILARGVRLSGARLVAPTVLSNHVHLLVQVDNAHQLAKFMGFINSNIARQIGRLHGWEGKFWQGRYRAIPVSGEEEAQVARLRYLLAQGCKEGLVTRPQDWPGLHAARAIASKSPLAGVWFNGTEYYRARLRTGAPRRIDHEEAEVLHLAALPCWAHLSATDYRERVRALAQEITQETQDRHRALGSHPLGRRAILRQHPHQRGNPLKKTRAPWIHAVQKCVREAYCSLYRAFVAAYRAAAQKLSSGNRMAIFPPGCFPPALPFEPPPDCRATE